MSHRFLKTNYLTKSSCMAVVMTGNVVIGHAIAKLANSRNSEVFRTNMEAATPHLLQYNDEAVKCYGNDDCQGEGILVQRSVSSRTEKPTSRDQICQYLVNPDAGAIESTCAHCCHGEEYNPVNAKRHDYWGDECSNPHNEHSYVLDGIEILGQKPQNDIASAEKEIVKESKCNEGDEELPQALNPERAMLAERPTAISRKHIIQIRDEEAATDLDSRYREDTLLTSRKLIDYIEGKVGNGIHLSQALQANVGKIMWITQLVVHRRERGKRIASRMLQGLIKVCQPDIAGVASSHPHGILALRRAARSTIDLGFIKRNLQTVLSRCEIEYLMSKPLVGALFDKDVGRGAIAQIDTGFLTDHEEPLRALENLKEWPLGRLLEGHEFVVIYKVGSIGV